MIVNVIGVPQVSLLEARLICGTLGLKLGHLRKRAPHFQSFRPQTQNYFGPLRVVYIDDLDVYNQYLDSLVNKPQHHCVLLNLSKSTLQEIDVTCHGDGMSAFTLSDMISLIENYSVREQGTILTRKVDLAREIMTQINKESLLGKLQTAFYRIKLVDERQRMQSLVYSYLCGSIKRLPDIPYSFLTYHLHGELCKRFVKAVNYAKTNGPDKAAEQYGIDRFEIAFVLKRGGHDV